MESAPLHHLANKLRVAANVLAIRSDIWNRKQLGELGEDLPLMSAPIVTD
jgi:hypothetical protein